jgi:hypothetical protein
MRGARRHYGLPTWRAAAPLLAVALRRNSYTTESPAMAQIIVSWFICDGRFRVHAINAVGRRPRRLIEIEEIDTGERIHGCARKLERVVRMLGSNYVD